jgi:hypothetical protein
LATFTETFCDPTNGSNLWGGSDNGKPSMADVVGAGAWVQATQLYTSNNVNGSVTVGQFIALYQGAVNTPSFSARVTNVAGGSGIPWVIGVSNAAYAGTAPGAVNGAINFNANVGGAWAGPTAAVLWPVNAANLANLTDAPGDPIRVNMLNSANYNLTAQLVVASVGPVTISGMAASPGDGGRATFSYGTSQVVYLTTSQVDWVWRDLVFTGAATAGLNAGIVVSGRAIMERVTVAGARINGFAITVANSIFIECEAYLCNTSNAATDAAYLCAGTTQFVRCTAHHNTQPNALGFSASVACTFVECIAAANGSTGFAVTGTALGTSFENCMAYANSGDGFKFSSTAGLFYLENCQFLLNAGNGVNNTGGATNVIRLNNCGDFGNLARLAGTTGVILDTGGVTFGSNPTSNGNNGNFAMNNANAIGTGRGTFLLTSNYALSSAGHPDIGPVQGNATQTSNGNGNGNSNATGAGSVIHHLFKGLR